MMYLVKLLYQLYLLGAYLWHRQLVPQLRHDTALHVGHPVVGVALRQGRRFTMEDRVVTDTRILPGGCFCSAANYTYVAVYDGHDGSVACDMLVRKLHPAIYTATAATWQSTCSAHHPRLQAAISHEAQQLNNAFLQDAKHHAEALQQWKLSHCASNTSCASSSQSATLFSRCDAVTNTDSDASGSTNDRAPGSTTDRAAGSTGNTTVGLWDGDDGSTAVFAVLVGKQLLVGNVGNSRAVLCTSHTSSHSSNSVGGSGSMRSTKSSGSCTALHSVSDRKAEKVRKPAGTDAITTTATSSSSSKDVVPFAVRPHSSSTSRGGVVELLQQQKHTERALMQRTERASADVPGSCSENQSQQSALADSESSAVPPKPLRAQPLSSDHTPEREDEADRIRRAGGQVAVNRATPGGKLRVRGELEVTRSFGDYGFQDQGVTAVPEFAIHTLRPGDAFLVLASDGVFEAVTTDEVCQHAWAVWSGSSLIRPALLPPPALALSGQVSSSGGIRTADDITDSAVNTAKLTGCCDCTPQQQLLAAAGVDMFDAQAAARRHRRQQRKQRAQNTSPDAQQDSADIVGQHRQEQLLSEEQQAMMTCRMGAADQNAWDGSCSWEGLEEVDLGLITDLEQEGTSDVSAAANAAFDNHQAEFITNRGSDSMAGASNLDLDLGADYIDEHGMADVTYSYCLNPVGTAAPYTLPQAIALRLANEAHNRMSMDNIAIAVLDIREAAAAAAGIRKQQQYPQQKHCDSAEGIAAATARPARPRQDLDSSSSISGGGSNSSQEADGAADDDDVITYEDDSLETAELLSLPRCELQFKAQHTAASATVGTAASPIAHMPASAVLSRQTSNSHSAVDQTVHSIAGSSKEDVSHSSTALQQLSPDWNWPGGLGGADLSPPTLARGTAVLCGQQSAAAEHQQPQHDLASAPMYHSAQQQDALSKQEQQAEAVAAQAGAHEYLLMQRMASAASRLPSHMHAHPALGVDEVHVNLEVGQQQQEAYGTHNTATERRDDDVLSVSRHMQPANMLWSLTDSLPQLGSSSSSGEGSVEREQLCRMLWHTESAVQQEHWMLQQQQQQLGQHYVPPALPATDSSSKPAADLALSSSSSSGGSAGRGSRRKVDYVQGLVHADLAPASSSSSDSAKRFLAADLAPSGSSSSDDQGFMSACLAGAAADYKTAIVPGAGGLSAVVAALTSIPRHDTAATEAAAAGDDDDFAAVAEPGSSSSSGNLPPRWQQQVRQQAAAVEQDTDLAAVAAADSNDWLIEPSWGRASISSTGAQDADNAAAAAATTVTKQQHAAPAPAVITAHSADSSSTKGGGAVLRAGLLMLLQKPRRTLHAWHKSVQQMLQDNAQPHPHAHSEEESPGVQQGHQHGVVQKLKNNDVGVLADKQLLLKEVLLADLSGSTPDGRYTLGKQYGRGHYGEVWSAVRSHGSSTSDRSSGSTADTAADGIADGAASNTVQNDGIPAGSTSAGAGSTVDDVAGSTGDAELLVMKRVSGSRGSAVRRSALREVYFGQLLNKHQQELQLQQQQQEGQLEQPDGPAPPVGNVSALLTGHNHLVRFVEGFTTQPGGDVWLVFKNEGRSLHNLMYAPVHTVAEADDTNNIPNQAADVNSNTTGDVTDQTAELQQQQQQDASSQPGGPEEAAATTAAAAGLSVVGPSRWWTAVRSSSDGHAFVASLMRQLLQGLAAVQAANVSHRDVKPENLLVRSQQGITQSAKPQTSDNAQQQQQWQKEGQKMTGRASSSIALDPDPLSLHLRLIDFGSAVDEPSVAKGLFGRSDATVAGGGGDGSGGPSLDELTLEYAPPEVIFSSRYRNPLAVPSQLHAYDIWSAGVVMLELILGTPAVFAPSPATRAALDKQLHLRGRPAGERQLLYVLRGLMELCIYPPRVKLKPRTAPTAVPTRSSNEADIIAGHNTAHGHQTQQQQQQELLEGQQTLRHNSEDGESSSTTAASSSSRDSDLPLPWSCSEELLLQLIASRDPTGLGLEGGLALRLLQRLLAWEPSQRPTAAQALQHAYFTADRRAAHVRADIATDNVQDSNKHADNVGQTRRNKLWMNDVKPQQRVGTVREMLLQQQELLKACSSAPVGEPGWC